MQPVRDGPRSTIASVRSTGPIVPVVYGTWKRSTTSV